MTNQINKLQTEIKLLNKAANETQYNVQTKSEIKANIYNGKSLEIMESLLTANVQRVVGMITMLQLMDMEIEAYDLDAPENTLSDLNSAIERRQIKLAELK